MLQYAKKEHLDQIIAIAEEQFGHGFVTHNNIERTKTFVSGNDPIAGFVSVQISPSNEQHGYIQTIAVSKQHQGKGIGQELFERGEQYLRNKGVTKIFVPAWKSPDGLNLERLLNKFGYTKQTNEIDFWSTSCEAEAFLCPYKTDGECRCTGIWYCKELDST